MVRDARVSRLRQLKQVLTGVSIEVSIMLLVLLFMSLVCLVVLIF